MSVLGKLMFWKKSDGVSDLGKDLNSPGDNFGMPSNNDPFGMQGDSFNSMQQSMNPGMDQMSQNPMMPSQSPMPPQNDFGQQSFSASPDSPRFAQAQPQQGYNQSNQMEEKNMEIISSKLDALKISIDSLNQRLANLEAMARKDEGHNKRYY